MRLNLSITDLGVTLERAGLIWAAGRDLLWKHGIEVEHDRLLADLAGQDGLVIDGHTVRIRPDFFEHHWADPLTLNERRRAGQHVEELIPRPCSKLTIDAGAWSLNVIDWRDGQRRPATVADLAESCRVVEAVGSSSYRPMEDPHHPGIYCLTPQDVPVMLRDIVTYKTCFENARTIRGARYSNPEQLPFIEQMCHLMGETLRLLVLVSGPPIRLSPVNVQNIYDSRRRGFCWPIWLIGYGVPGIGSPARLSASAAMVLAQHYGAAVLLRCAFPDRPVRAYANPGYAPDFQHCNYALGAPHTFVYDLVNLHLVNALAGVDPAEQAIAPVDMGLWTGACDVDAQAAAEKASLAMIGALLGVNHYSMAGALAVDDLFSLEQFMIDRQIVTHARDTVAAAGPSEVLASTDDLRDELASAFDGEEFLTLPSTLDVMRTLFRPGAMFEHRKLASWVTAGATSIREKAHRQIADALAASDFALDDERQDALNEIYRQARDALE